MSHVLGCTVTSNVFERQLCTVIRADVRSTSCIGVLQHEVHTLDGRTVDVKAAMPKSRGGSKEKGLKMFVGGLPVSSCCVYS